MRCLYTELLKFQMLPVAEQFLPLMWELATAWDLRGYSSQEEKLIAKSHIFNTECTKSCLLENRKSSAIRTHFPGPQTLYWHNALFRHPLGLCSGACSNCSFFGLGLALNYLSLWLLAFTSCGLSWWAYISPGAECHRGDTWEQVGTKRVSCSFWSPGRDIFTCTRQSDCEWQKPLTQP